MTAVACCMLHAPKDGKTSRIQNSMISITACCVVEVAVTVWTCGPSPVQPEVLLLPQAQARGSMSQMVASLAQRAPERTAEPPPAPQKASARKHKRNESSKKASPSKPPTVSVITSPSRATAAYRSCTPSAGHSPPRAKQNQMK